MNRGVQRILVKLAVGKVHGGFADQPVDELVGSFLLVRGAALDHGGSGHAVACAFLRIGHDQRIALVHNRLRVVGIADRHADFAQARGGEGRRARLGVHEDVLVQLLQVFEPFLLAQALDGLGQHGVGRAGGGRVGNADLALEFGLQQVFPAGRGFQSFFLKPFLVAAEAGGNHVQRHIHAVGIDEPLIHVPDVRGGIGIQQVFLDHRHGQVVAHAEDHGHLGIFLFCRHAHLHFAGAQPLILHIDAGFLLEQGNQSGNFRLHVAAVHGERILLLHLIGEAACREHRKTERKAENERDNLFHFPFPP